MLRRAAQFLLSIETECLTATPDNPELRDAALARLLTILRQLAPSLPATSGLFTGYARMYVDVGHFEIALCELDSPYLVPLVFERAQALVSRALAQLAAEGTQLVLANNNHSGLLTSEAATWGTHENYLVEQHPTSFSLEILPFLVTRIYGGSGGVLYPTGVFVAGTRSLRLAMAVGGGTTDMRAIHSTARDENHMGPAARHFRYHLILGDGHRSHFNLALQLGATALAIKAVLRDRQLRREVRQLRHEFPEDWVAALRGLNVLAQPGQSPRVDPLVIRTQRCYLAGAERFTAKLSPLPEWVPRLLQDWRDTLDAYERMDRAWLSSRLDAFAKFELYGAVLKEADCSWARLASRPQLFHELALLDHNYHEFANPASVFQRLESSGVLQHRVGPQIAPGEEAESFVPETTTRARTRARFIRTHQGSGQFVVDWSIVQDRTERAYAHLHDPFAQQFSEWVADPSAGPNPFQASRCSG